MTVDDTALIYNRITEHFNHYQTSSTVNVWNCLLRMNIWKLSPSVKKSCSVHRFQKHYSVSQKWRVFLGPRKTSLEILKIVSRQKISSFNSRFTGVICLKIDRKLREILHFHNKCSTEYWTAPPLEKSSAFSAGKLRFFDKMTLKRHREYKYIIEGTYKPRILSHHSWKLVNGLELHTKHRI